MFLWIFIWGLCFREGYSRTCYRSSECTRTCYRGERFIHKCGTWGWKRCSGYRRQAHDCKQMCYESFCCSGYKGHNCNTPICSTSCRNGGTCQSPGTCRCRTGYSEPYCDDRNECNYGNGGCEHNCINTHGSYYCSCRTGYTRSSSQKSCLDINECSSYTHGCQHNCINTYGSYYCSCRPGYSLVSNHKSCLDVNECNTNNGGCEQICKNSIGSFTCDCTDGHKLNTDKKTCSDVNECALGTSDCEQICNNTEGSYTCSCKSGYVLAIDGKKCEDIDECSLQSNQCTEYCQNTQGSYFCYCDTGFEITSDGLSCQDVNECALGTSDCEHICNNTEGSYTCSCESGYVLATDGKKCEDIDECSLQSNQCTESSSCQDVNKCALGTSDCEHICINTEGSYTCSCKSGYVLTIDGKTCEDEDECLKGNITCDQICINVVGSYKCECNSGYTMTDTSFEENTCHDIDECGENTPGCSQICNNTDGSYFCDCYSGYSLDNDNKTCLDDDDCEGVICQNGGSCIDRLDSFTCICNEGFGGALCEADINECEILNGGCQDICMNTFGSFNCNCLDGPGLNEDGFSCKENNISVFERLQIPRQLLPKACFTVKLVEYSDGRSSDIFLSSTSEWYRLNSNPNVVYTPGIVFVKSNFSLPISLRGVEFTTRNEDFTLNYGVHYDSANGTVIENNLTTADCQAFELIKSDMFDFISVDSFTKTFLLSLFPVLPYWLEFEKSSTEILAVQDIKSDLVYGRNMDDVTWCAGAPVLPNHLYTVFKLNTGLKISLLGDEVDLPKPVQSRKFCLIVDLCQSYGGTVFLMIPEESRDSLLELNIFKTLKKEWGIDIKPRGFGISLENGVNAGYHSFSGELWNGDNMFLPLLPQVDFWIGCKLLKHHRYFTVNGSADIYMGIPSVQKMLTSMFREEWTGVIDIQLSLSPVLRFKLFGEKYLVSFPSATSIAYASLGGSSRMLCDDVSNPEGVFLSATVETNPFKGIPYLEDLYPDLSHRMFLFVITDKGQNASGRNSIRIKDRILEIESLLNDTMAVLDDALDKIVPFQEMVIEMRITINTIGNILRQKFGESSVLIENLEDGFIDIHQMLYKYRSTLYNLADKTEFIVNTTTEQLVELLRTHALLLTQSIRDVSHDITRNILSSFGNYTGLGFKFTCHWTVFGLELFWIDIEIVYSEEEFFRCSRFDETRKLLNGESALRILGRFTRKNKLGRFLSCNKGFGLGSALAINSRNVMLQLEASINMLGIEVTGDLFISKNGINFYLEGNVWNIFLVQIDVSAEVGKEWNQLIFSLQGQFVARANSERVNTSSSLMQSNYLEDIKQRSKSQVQTDSFSFQDSYLDALVKAVGLISGVAEKRVSQAQVALSIAQKNVQKAKSWLDEKKLAVRKANVIFDNAVKSLEVARGNIEAAKGPFAEALEKLKNAQKNIDNLCRIRNCSNICIPGIKCKICFFKGFSGIKFRHPCCWSTECMISFPDPLCLLANLACRIIRTAAYVILELANIFVRTAMLTFDIAKAAVTVAQIVVDKSRVILTVAEGILELANIGLEVAEGILKAAKFALAAIKQVIEASVKVLQFVIEYGLKNIIDVRNCGFNIELSTRDMPVFDVVCEVNPFRLGWTKIKLRINFKNIFQSLWQAAKATISAIINIFDGIFSDRRRHDIEFDASTRMHVLLRTIRESNGLNNTDTYWNETIDIVNDIAGFGDKVESDSENRIQLFSEKCKKMTVIQDFMQVAFQSLQEVSNESKSYILEIVNVKELLKGYSNVRPNVDITLDNVGISKEYAEKDFNMTDSDLQRAVEDIKSAVADDPLLVEIQKAADVSKQCLEDEAQSVESVDYQNAWFTSMDNMTREYFNKSECVGFKDCIFYSISCLYDLYEYEDIPNITIIRQSILDIENKLIEAFQNESSSIQDTSLAMEYVLYRINALIEMNIFCSKPPEFLTRLQNQTVIYGNEVQFFCHVKGDPEPSYVWLLNDTVIENENKCRLILSKVTDENSYDKYNCVAGNVVANVTSTDAYITVVLEDEDECQTENGNCQQFCNNTVGSYFCSCFDGFEPDDQNKYICKDTDECQTENGSCQQFCNNTVGSYFCSCFEGFIPDEQNKYLCKDSDECEKDNGGCQHACTNEEGSFTCSCKGGFILQSDSRTCVDVDECKTNNGECQHICTNEAGTFICSCRSGYELHVNNSSCIDIDECKTNNGGCQHKCSNELGSFSCSCNDGFSLHSDNKTCTEISECILKSIGCQHTCINETESFTCLCYDGYELETNNKSCNDINECKANMSACQHTCFNTVGSFYCTCLGGYQLENDGITCSDIDECEEGNSGCEHICRNTEGSFQCACSNGFKLTMDNKTCADINECETDNGGCEHKCINTDGSVTCFCEDGFKLEKDVKSCMDVNASDESG